MSNTDIPVPHTELVIDIPQELSASDMTRVMKPVREVVASILDLRVEDVIVTLG